MRTLMAAILVAGTASAPLAAHAQLNAEVSISKLRYTLIDLDLNDGLAPSIEFLPTSTYKGGGSVTYDDRIAPFTVSSPAYAPFGDFYASLGTAAGDAMVQSSGALWNDYVLRASVTMPEPYQRDTGVWASGASLIDFVLGPGTLVKFAADSIVAGSVSANDPDSLLWGHKAYVLASLGVSGADSPSSARYLPGESGSLASTLYTSFANDSGTAPTDYLSAYVSVQAVPEPETWGMLLGGLAVVGAALRRRARA